MVSDPIVIEYESSLLKKKTRSVRGGAAIKIQSKVALSQGFAFGAALKSWTKSWWQGCIGSTKETSSEEEGRMKRSKKDTLQENSIWLFYIGKGSVNR